MEGTIERVKYQGIERYLSGETRMTVDAYKLLRRKEGKTFPEFWESAQVYADALGGYGEREAAQEIEARLSQLQALNSVERG